MNLVVISGRFTDDPQGRKTNGGEDMAACTLALNEGYGEKKRTMYIDVTAFGNVAKTLVTYGRKGKRAAVRGRIDISYYVKDEEKRKTFRVIAESVDIIDWPERKEEYHDEIPDEMLPF